MSEHGWNHNPVARRVVNLDSCYYILSKRIKCDSCKKSCSLYEDKILAQLPQDLANEFPAFLTHRSGIDKTLVTLIRSGIAQGTTAHGWERILRELHVRNRDLAEQEYLHALKNCPASQLPVPLVPFSSFGDKEAYAGFAPSRWYINSVYTDYMSYVKPHQDQAMFRDNPDVRYERLGFVVGYAQGQAALGAWGISWVLAASPPPAPPVWVRPYSAEASTPWGYFCASFPFFPLPGTYGGYESHRVSPRLAAYSPLPVYSFFAWFSAHFTRVSVDTRGGESARVSLLVASDAIARRGPSPVAWGAAFTALRPRRRSRPRRRRTSQGVWAPMQGPSFALQTPASRSPPWHYPQLCLGSRTPTLTCAVYPLTVPRLTVPRALPPYPSRTPWLAPMRAERTPTRARTLRLPYQIDHAPPGTQAVIIVKRTYPLGSSHKWYFDTWPAPHASKALKVSLTSHFVFNCVWVRVRKPRVFLQSRIVPGNPDSTTRENPECVTLPPTCVPYPTRVAPTPAYPYLPLPCPYPSNSLRRTGACALGHRAQPLPCAYSTRSLTLSYQIRYAPPGIRAMRSIQ
ncbi:hypothetical protein B0H16DRAFT_1897139 [Mycena metata]|uniref:DUF6729 domain-containing protein n=1 Tax=Mycena metata TaxID=1033252 RepID=A0AAD7MIS9_9AGAR|nr:hypothetical protein B0H16DRAFT_1897139 [Mycena metata]